MKRTLLAIPVLVLFTQASKAFTIDALSKQEILEIVDSARSGVTDLFVSQSFDLTTGGRADSIIQTHWEFVCRDNRFLMRKQWSLDPTVEDVSAERWVAYNGDVTTAYSATNGHDRRAGISAGYPIDMRVPGNSTSYINPTDGIAFFDFNLLRLPVDFGDGHSDRRLTSLLRRPEASIRPNLEPVGDRPCYVLDMSDPNSGAVVMSVWLDVDRGGVPLRQQYFTGASHSLAMEFEATEVNEVSPGLWLVTSGIKRTQPGNVPELPNVQEWLMQVDHDQNGLVLFVNAGIDPTVFDLWNALPAGTLLGDQRTGAVRRIASANQETIASTFLASLDGNDRSNEPNWLDASAAHSGAALPDTWSMGWNWLALMTCSLGVASVIVIRCR